ncbi:carbohydrate binding family 9 domain-containing protein [Cyclobacteriaceae bacterium]|nr:carbohydrate binding family 9 domain-containing protein [Cyclobacteriaceae bacterium]
MGFNFLRFFLLFYFWVLSYVLFAQNNGEVYQLNIQRMDEKIHLDGVLDESFWEDVEIATNFWLNFPVGGTPVDDEVQTTVKITYDDDFIYLGVECYGKGPFLVQSLKRDNDSFWNGDAFAVVFDPVNERTNGVIFGVNPAGVQTEALITGEPARRGGQLSGYNKAWDNKWYTQASVTENGWTAEMMIPFKSLRFGRKGHWGINFIRVDAQNNANHSWAPVPIQFYGTDLGYLGQLIWDKPPRNEKGNISLVPYLLGNVYKDYESKSDLSQSFALGMDAKIAINSNLNLDLTVNPDFSQVDVDEQQTNLTTVNLRFPERRLFFLENSDIFSNFGTNAKPFFSRKIGLDDDGNTIPIIYGARLSGNLNKNLRIGLMNTQTQEQELPGNNYSSFALHRRILKRAVLRGYFHNRVGYTDGSVQEDNFNRIGGLEFNYSSEDSKWRAVTGYGLAFSNENQNENHLFNLFGGYGGRAFNVMVNISGLGDNYINDFSLIPRQKHYDALEDTTYILGFNHWWATMGYKFYPENTFINQHGFSLTTNGDRTATSNQLIQDKHQLSYKFLMKNTSTLDLTYAHEGVNLLYPFGFTDNEPLPAKLYRFDYGQIKYVTDRRREIKLTSGFRYGSFYNGTRTEFSLAVDYRVQPWGNFSLNFVQNDLEFSGNYGAEQLLLFGPKAEINFSKNFFWTTFMQYNTQSDNFNINSRLQWRYMPMSDLFIVYSDNYMVEYFGPRNRGLVLKLNYWFNL